MVTANAAERLLQHYVDNSRSLPWRSPPGTAAPDPYIVWLSEIMLQQTTVAAVAPRFTRFVNRWPTVEALAAAEDADVLGEWAGLGYYARARNLIACARQVVRQGGFPAGAAELKQLPGIGSYTSAAIAAIAFGAHEAAIDTNVERVVARLDGIEQPDRRRTEARVLAMLPRGKAGDFAQAMMDLGATVCRARAPQCSRCPIRTECKAFASGDPERFPARKSKVARPLRHGIAWWTERDGHVWLVRRPERGMLGGMAALPGSDWVDQPSSSPRHFGSLRHVFTHFVLELQVEPRSEPVGDGWWHPIERFEQAGLPTLYKKAVKLVLEASSQSIRAA